MKKVLNWKKIILTICGLLILAFLFPAASPVHADSSPTCVRVLLSTQGAGTLTCKVTGRYQISETLQKFGEGTLTIRAKGSNIILSHSESGELYSGTRITIKRLDPGRDGGTISMKVVSGTRAFLGDFYITANDSVLTVINSVPLSHYLYGVVGYEMSNEFPVEALKSQAIAAKCYALMRIGSGKGYDLGDTAEDQVYKGYVPSYTNVITAVDETMGRALYYNGALLQCYYAASDGGYMILPSTRWSSDALDGAYRKGEDLYDMKNPSSPNETVFYSSTFSRKDAGRKPFSFLEKKIFEQIILQKLLPARYRFGAVSSIDQVSSAGKAGYAGDLNHTTVSVEATVRADLDHSLIPSPTPSWAPTPSPTPFPEGITDPADLPTPTPSWPSTPSPTPGQVLTREIPVSVSFSFDELFSAGIFHKNNLKITYAESLATGFNLRHARYGHGVGMSQRGAQQMAYEGFTYEQILAYYYPGAVLEKIDYIFPESLPGASGSVPAGTALNAASSDLSGAAPALSSEYETAPSSGQISGAEQVNLRSRASTGSESLGLLKSGTPLALNGLMGDWYYVTTADGLSGFVRNDYVSVTGHSIIALGSVSGSEVNFRSGPGTGHDSLGRLSHGTSVGIYGLVNGWYRVRVGSYAADGYISKSYVSLTQATYDGSEILVSAPSPTPDPYAGNPTPILIGIVTPTPSPTPAPTRTPTAIYAAQGKTVSRETGIRSGASEKADQIAVLEEGTILRITDKNGSWYSASAPVPGLSGYVYSPFVELNREIDRTGRTLAHARGTVSVSGTVVRSAPDLSGDPLEILQAGENVRILGSSGIWYDISVSSGKAEGYVLQDLICVSAPQEKSTNTGTAVSSFMLRSSPSFSHASSPVLSVPAGASVSIDSSVNGWLRIRYDSKVGYVPIGLIH